jgi:hypothetical protein
MDKPGKIVASIRIDVTELDAQLHELKGLLESVPHNVQGPLLSNLLTVLNDIVLTDISPATGAGLDIIQSVRLGAKYKRFTAAIRAGELNANFL